MLNSQNKKDLIWQICLIEIMRKKLVTGQDFGFILIVITTIHIQWHKFI